MRKAVAVAIIALCAYLAIDRVRVSKSVAQTESASPAQSTLASSSVTLAYERHAQNVTVDGDGVVWRVLPDDNNGERHQRFLVRLPSGISLLIAHNIDIAPRVENLRVGDSVEFEGEYVWNDKGGMVHWTHHDPAGRHRSGFLKHDGRTYR